MIKDSGPMKRPGFVKVVPAMPSFGTEFQNGCVSVHPGTGGCWIDGTVDTSLHDHHLIPQNAGGTNGPQARICSDCHNSIHYFAQLWEELEGDIEAYMRRPDCKGGWNTPETKQRAKWLSKVIYESEKLAAQSKNKTTKVNLTLTATQNQKLNYLSSRWGMSKTAVLKLLIERA